MSRCMLGILVPFTRPRPGAGPLQRIFPRTTLDLCEPCYRPSDFPGAVVLSREPARPALLFSGLDIRRRLRIIRVGGFTFVLHDPPLPDPDCRRQCPFRCPPPHAPPPPFTALL